MLKEYEEVRTMPGTSKKKTWKNLSRRRYHHDCPVCSFGSSMITSRRSQPLNGSNQCLGIKSEEGNGLASEFGDGGKRDLLVLLLRDVPIG